MKLSEAKQEFTKRTQMPAKKAFAELVVAPGSLQGKRMTSTADWVWVLENMDEAWDKSVVSCRLSVVSQELEQLREETRLLSTENSQLTTENSKLRAEQNELLAELEQEKQRVAELHSCVERCRSEKESLLLNATHSASSMEQQLAQAQQKPADEAEAVAIAAVGASDDVASAIVETVLSFDFKGWYRRLAVYLHPDTTRLEKHAAQKAFRILNGKYNQIKEKESGECNRILRDDELRCDIDDIPF